MNFYSDNAPLLLGTWLRRISETYLQEISQIYNSLSIRFEPSWFPIFFILSKQEKVTITELAKMMEVSQPAISQMAAVLQKSNLITITTNKVDARKKDIILSPKGKQLLNQVQPVWKALNQGVNYMLNQNQSTNSLIEGLKVLENEIQIGKLRDLTLAIISSPAYEIRNMNENGQIDLYKYFHEMEGVSFTYPSEGSNTLVAKVNDEIIGAIAFEALPGSDFILHNLYVKKNHRLKGVAKALLERAMPKGKKPCILMDRATPELVDLLLKCSYSFKVEISPVLNEQ